MTEITIVGGGLAGSEAAWQLADRGFPVRLLEMRPQTPTGAHKTDRLAEIVCSNSFKSTLLDGLAHEFKTPLTSIKAAASALLTSSVQDPKQQQ